MTFRNDTLKNSGIYLVERPPQPPERTPENPQPIKAAPRGYKEALLKINYEHFKKELEALQHTQQDLRYSGKLIELKNMLNATQANQSASLTDSLITDTARELFIACSPEYNTKIDFRSLQARSQIDILIALESTIHILKTPLHTNNQALMSDVYHSVKDNQELGAKSPLAIAIGSIVLALGMIALAAAVVATAGVALPILAGLSTTAIGCIAGGGLLTASVGAFTLGYGLTEDKVVSPMHKMHSFFEKNPTSVKVTESAELKAENPQRLAL